MAGTGAGVLSDEVGDTSAEVGSSLMRGGDGEKSGDGGERVGSEGTASGVGAGVAGRSVGAEVQKALEFASRSIECSREGWRTFLIQSLTVSMARGKGSGGAERVVLLKNAMASRLLSLAEDHPATAFV